MKEQKHAMEMKSPYWITASSQLFLLMTGVIELQNWIFLPTARELHKTGSWFAI